MACRLAALAAVVVGLALPALPAAAMVVTTTTLPTTEPPADDPGWANVASGSSGPNFTYLGDGWALSAWHVWTAGGPPFTFGNGTFSAIPNQVYRVPNPAGSGLSTYTDLQLVRLDGDPGLPTLSIASQAPTEQGAEQTWPEMTYIGRGRSRMPNATSWNVSGTTWTEVPGGGGTYQGYSTTSDYTKRWGKNRVADEDALFSTNDNDLRGTVHLPSYNLDVISLFTRFDQTGSTVVDYEAQAVAGDSGSAVFRKVSGQWELAGIVNTVYTYENQPSVIAVYGTYTSFADLSYYRNEILNIMNAHTAYSVMGDVNLDGVVSGDGTGSAATDDVTAFVQGWNWYQATANVESWKKGDLNLDGTTNTSDFFLMRGALAGAGQSAGAATLATLFGPAAVPEPTNCALVGAAVGIAFGIRRPRKKAP